MRKMKDKWRMLLYKKNDILKVGRLKSRQENVLQFYVGGFSRFVFFLRRRQETPEKERRSVARAVYCLVTHWLLSITYVYNYFSSHWLLPTGSQHNILILYSRHFYVWNEQDNSRSPCKCVALLDTLQYQSHPSHNHRRPLAGYTLLS